MIYNNPQLQTFITIFNLANQVLAPKNYLKSGIKASKEVS